LPINSYLIKNKEFTKYSHKTCRIYKFCLASKLSMYSKSMLFTVSIVIPAFMDNFLISNSLIYSFIFKLFFVHLLVFISSVHPYQLCGMYDDCTYIVLTICFLYETSFDYIIFIVFISWYHLLIIFRVMLVHLDHPDHR